MRRMRNRGRDFRCRGSLTLAVAIILNTVTLAKAGGDATLHWWQGMRVMGSRLRGDEALMIAG